MKKYIDTHCHLNGQFYKTDIKEDISQAIEQGIFKIIMPGTSKEDSLAGIELAKDYPFILYPSAGLHPCDAFTPENSNFLESINHEDIVAVGETGIDLYHTDTNPPLAMQLINFQKHIAYALKYDKPIIVHGRSAEKEVYEELSKHKGLRIIMHCYTGNWEWAQKFLELGAYISIAGAITYNKTETIREVAIKTPLDKLIVETDSPFLTPVPNRGKTNKPEYVRHVAEFVANAREENNEIVLEALFNNTIKAFGLENK